VFADGNSVTVDGVGLTYDASGSMSNDGNNTLVYDAENRLLSATNGGSSGAYTYDGNGLRVTKASGSTTTVYIFSGSKVIAEYDNGAAVGSPSREYIYSGGALLVKIDSSGTMYYHQDQLSSRLVTDSSGNTLAQMGHYPFGESWYNASNDKLLFTSYERDSESGNDYAMARYHVNRLGRFSSADLLAGSIDDPQSPNRYSYARMDPINLVDPSGREVCEPAKCGDNGGGGGGGDDDGGQGGPPVPPDLGPPDFGPPPDFGQPQQPTAPIDPGCTNANCASVSADAPPDFPPFSSSFLYQLDISSNILGNLRIYGSLSRLRDLLKDDPDCLNFLSSNKTDAMGRLNDIIKFGSFGQDLLPISTDSSGNITGITNAVSGPTFLAPPSAITVNSLGAFFYKNFLGVPILPTTVE